MRNEDQTDGAELTGQTIPDVEGTEPRPIRNQIICAAIRFHKDGSIVRGHRHDACYKTAMGIPALRDYLHQADQGFIDARNQFVDRKEAMRIQIAAGIPSHDGNRMEDGAILFSEDLY